MNIKELKIEGFKSIGSITLKNPNNFSVFVGANASGKSNIFEALEFLEMCTIMHPFEAARLFGNVDDIFNRVEKSNIRFLIDLGEIKPQLNLVDFNSASSSYLGGGYRSNIVPSVIPKNTTFEEIYKYIEDPSYIHFSNFSRIFIGQKSKLQRNDDLKLSTAESRNDSNMEKVLKRLLQDENTKAEIFEALELFIPGFKSIEIVSNQFSGSDDLLFFFEFANRPFPKHLISDGTINILAILTALYQSKEPQFLCIEEPENGLNPKVIRVLVNIIRELCKTKGHYIWLNTHSQTLISELTTDELIIVDNKNGLTEVKQIQGMNLHGLTMDEAFFSNAIGGGLPW